jgi:hypothetical protein
VWLGVRLRLLEIAVRMWTDGKVDSAQMRRPRFAVPNRKVKAQQTRVD